MAPRLGGARLRCRCCGGGSAAAGLAAARAALARDGAAVVRGAVPRAWVDAAREAVARQRRSPSPRGEELAGFYSDLATGNEALGALGAWGPAADLARALMLGEEEGATAVRDGVVFYHEHVLVKDAGCSTRTPLHADAAYYPLDGGESGGREDGRDPHLLSLWVALDEVPLEASVRYWRASHVPPLLPAGALWAPRKFATGELYERDVRGADDASGGWPPPSGAIYAEAPVEVPSDAAMAADTLAWACAPGDAVAFDARTLHWAPGNDSRAAHDPTPRRALALRYARADARVVGRPWAPSPALPREAHGAVVASDWLTLLRAPA